MKVYTIVVSYNGEKYIESCLASLQNSTIATKIIVVDNNSTDKTVSIIRERFKDVFIIESPKNLGFGKANNIGLKIALQESADYVFLLNQDAKVDKDTIEKLIDVQQRNKSFGILSPIHLDYEGNNLEYYFSTIVNPFDCPEFISDLYFGRLKELYPIKFVHAACWLISRQCLEEVGGFDPLFIHYGEDNDYVNRAVYKKFQIGIVTTAKVYHDGKYNLEKNKDIDFSVRYSKHLLKLKNLNITAMRIFALYLLDFFLNTLNFLFYRKFKLLVMDIKIFFVLMPKFYRLIKSKELEKSSKSYLV